MAVKKWALSNIGPAKQARNLPLTLAPSAATTYNLESTTYKGLYTNKILINGTTHVATVLLPKVAENKGCFLEFYQSAGANYGVIKYQTGEGNDATVVTLSAAQLSAILYSNGSTWAIVGLSATNVNA